VVFNFSWLVGYKIFKFKIKCCYLFSEWGPTISVVGSVVTILGCAAVVATSLCIGVKKVLWGVYDCLSICCQRIYWPRPRYFRSVEARDEFRVNMSQRQGDNISMTFHIPKDEGDDDGSSKVKLRNLKKQVNLTNLQLRWPPLE